VTDGRPAPASALIVEIPEAEPLVADWRAAHDPSAALGVPPHVTILFPFVPPGSVSPDVLAAIRGLAGSQAPFTARLGRVERRADVVWLTVEPEDRFRALVRAAWSRFPDWPPYGGRFDDVIPHLTIGQGDGTTMADLSQEVELAIMDRPPLIARIDALSLFVSGGGHWSRTARFPLGAAEPQSGGGSSG
jgi:2'-5' RNA ligase